MLLSVIKSNAQGLFSWPNSPRIFDYLSFHDTIFLATDSGVCTLTTDRLEKIDGFNVPVDRLAVCDNKLFCYSPSNGIGLVSGHNVERIYEAIKERNAYYDIDKKFLFAKKTNGFLAFSFKTHLVIYDSTTKQIDTVYLRPLGDQVKDVFSIMNKLLIVAGGSLPTSGDYLYEYNPVREKKDRLVRLFPSKFIFEQGQLLIDNLPAFFIRNEGLSTLSQDKNGWSFLKIENPPNLASCQLQSIFLSLESPPDFDDNLCIATTGKYRDKSRWLAKVIKNRIVLIDTLGREEYGGKIMRFGDSTFLSTSSRIILVKDALAQVYCTSGSWIHDFLKIGNKLYLATAQGLTVTIGVQGPQHHELPGMLVKKIFSIDTSILVFTSPNSKNMGGAWTYRNQHFEQFSTRTFFSPAALNLGGRIYLMDLGAVAFANDRNYLYLFDPEVRLSVKLESRTESWLNHLFPTPIRLNGYRLIWTNDLKATPGYFGAGGAKYPYESMEPRIVISNDSAKLAGEIDSSEYFFNNSDRVEKFERIYDAGTYDDFIFIHDDDGNMSLVRDKFWVLPAWIVSTGIIVLLWGLLLAVIIGLAPNITFCNALLMNPYLRTYGSFGLIPFVLSLSPRIRRHLLKRYRQGVTKDRSFKAVKDKFILPENKFQLADLLKEVDQQGKNCMLLTGQAGIGKTTCLEFWTITLASEKSSHYIPIFIPLRSYQSKSPMEMFEGQLANRGGFRDSGLAAWFLLQGGFIFFFDGLNEVGAEKISEIQSFVSDNNKRNTFILSSQMKPEELREIPTMPIQTIEKSFIEKFIAQMVGKDSLEYTDIMGKLTRVNFIKTPFDLELLVDQWKAKKELPSTIVELYDRILDPIYSKLIDQGYQASVALLSKTCFEMVRDYTSFLPNESDYPMALITDLMESRIFVREVGKVRFQHDLLRSYLGSNYLIHNYSLLFSGGIAVHDDFSSLLRFSILKMTDLKSFFFELLPLNQRLAKELFQDTLRQQPEKVEAWKDEFYVRYGKLNMEQV
jgi:hypothetical protein